MNGCLQPRKEVSDVVSAVWLSEPSTTGRRHSREHWTVVQGWELAEPDPTGVVRKNWAGIIHSWKGGRTVPASVPHSRVGNLGDETPWRDDVALAHFVCKHPRMDEGWPCSIGRERPPRMIARLVEGRETALAGRSGAAVWPTLRVCCSTKEGGKGGQDPRETTTSVPLRHHRFGRQAPRA